MMKLRSPFFLLLSGSGVEQQEKRKPFIGMRLGSLVGDTGFEPVTSCL